MKKSLLVLSLLIALTSRSQFYYNDIKGNSLLTTRAKDLFLNNVRSVSATGYDAQGVKSSDYNEWQELIPATKTLKLNTRNGQQVTRLTYTFGHDFSPLTLIDSAAGFRSVTTYTYAGIARNLVRIQTNVTDSVNNFQESVDHQYSYSAQGKLSKLLRIVNTFDTTEYRFTIDKNGNVGSEQLFRRNTGLDKIDYYYDEQNRLTDVVRYDKKTKQDLPDYMFEYDEEGRVIQQLAVLSATTRNYLIWRYAYNDKGLKSKEALFNKQKELTGRIEYTYVYYP